MIGLRQIASNFTAVELDDLTIYFSYETPVAFETNDDLVLAENVWSQTTGKHLNMLDIDKRKRLPIHEFAQRLQAATSGVVVR